MQDFNDFEYFCPLKKRSRSFIKLKPKKEDATEESTDLNFQKKMFLLPMKGDKIKFQDSPIALKRKKRPRSVKEFVNSVKKFNFRPIDDSKVQNLISHSFNTEISNLKDKISSQKEKEMKIKQYNELWNKSRENEKELQKVIEAQRHMNDGNALKIVDPCIQPVTFKYLQTMNLSRSKSFIISNNSKRNRTTGSSICKLPSINTYQTMTFSRLKKVKEKRIKGKKIENYKLKRIIQSPKKEKKMKPKRRLKRSKTFSGKKFKFVLNSKTSKQKLRYLMDPKFKNLGKKEIKMMKTRL